jgi:RNA polymerase sigma factor (sigma-70 family)
MKAVAIRRFRLPPEEADELVHDVFATYLGRPSDDIASVKAYLLVATCRAARRRKQRYRRFDESLPTQDEHGQDVIDAGAEKSILLRIAIADALTACSPRCRDLIYRNAVTGESPEEIASSLRTTAQYVRQLLSSCRKHLRELKRELFL